jgi:hypothetical protein
VLQKKNDLYHGRFINMTDNYILSDPLKVVMKVGLRAKPLSPTLRFKIENPRDRGH